MTVTDTEIDPSSEIDVDLEADENELYEAALARATESDYLGDYPTIIAYLRAQLEPEVSAGVQWILDCIDYDEVQERWESDGSRLVLEAGRVYRVAAPDLSGPWMPTRGL